MRTSTLKTGLNKELEGNIFDLDERSSADLMLKKYGRVEGVSVSGRGQTAGTADGPLIES
jgi:hypothetical protein